MPIYDTENYDEDKMYYVPPAADAIPRDDYGFCPWCGKPLNKKRGPYSEFIGCSGYVNGCKYSRPMDPKVKSRKTKPLFQEVELPGTTRIVRPVADITDEGYSQIIKDGQIVADRCSNIKKKHSQFDYRCALNYVTYTKKAVYQKNRRGIVITILGANTTAIQDAWYKIIQFIVKDTCFLHSKAYIDRYQITTYYLTPNWRKFIQGPNLYDNYVVPPPKEEPK